MCGDTFVSSSTEYHVAWEERDGPVYCHGSDVHGGGPQTYHVADYISDPWGWGTSDFSYAYAHNWGGGSETYSYYNPFTAYTFVWGNTIDVWYSYYYYWFRMDGNDTALSSQTLPTDFSISSEIPTGNFTYPAPNPYKYNATTNTYTPVG